MNDNVYQQEGFRNRSAYLNWLALSNNIDPETVYMMAELFGEKEDFDALPEAVNFEYEQRYLPHLHK